MTKEQLLKKWEELICKKSKEVDPESEYTWEALFIGMAIAYGFSPDKAREIYNNGGYELEGQFSE